MGELLFRISGISGKTEIEQAEDEVPTTSAVRTALVDVLGAERRDRILASIYIARQDSAGVVRQLSMHIWKALVQNTPRTIREILSTLSTASSLLLLN